MRLPFEYPKQPITSTDRGEGGGAFGVCEERDTSITYCGLLKDRREVTLMVLVVPAYQVASLYLC